MHDENSQHPVERLAEMLVEFGDYPEGVEPVPACITGLAFFPGGAGLWGAAIGRPLPPMPVGKVMIIGHNFDSKDNYQKSLAKGTENVNGPTWRTLLALLSACDIAPEDCFFTNAYMGLKADTDKATGKNTSTGTFPGAGNHAFSYHCHAFLLKQIRAQQPRVVLTLGEKVLPMLAPLAPELTAAWRGASHLSDVDKSAGALVYPVHFPGVPHPSAVVALTHLANRGPNVKRRRYRELEGPDAERALIHEALVASGLVD
ncbi:MAG TPA: uracil-DNA glycosylase family protein [Ktedonobacterales bacterium]|jgi:hypothetical protein|nr:uracil-DNA glycosylase family protein [Ktedonobacterales bacterium]